MLRRDDLSFIEELELPIDEPSELVDALPEMRHYLNLDRGDEEGGLRSILERPEALSKAWWNHGNPRSRRVSKAKRRRPAAPRAA